VHKVTYPGVLRRHRGQKESVLQDLTHEHASTHDEPLAFWKKRTSAKTPTKKGYSTISWDATSQRRHSERTLSPDPIRGSLAEESWAHLAIEGQELSIRDLEALSAYRWK